MIKWLKSGLCKFGFMMSMLGAGTMGQGCEFLVPEGQLVKIEADGVISEQEEAEMIGIMEKEHKVTRHDKDGNPYEITDRVGVMKFEGPVQMLINDTDVYFNNEFEERGLYREGIDNSLHFYMPKDDQEFKKKYKKTHANLDEAPSYSSAFYSGANHTIYIPKGRLLDSFYTTMHHEIGHSLRISDEEFPAMANENYARLKTYALNQTLGSRLLLRSIDWMPRKATEDWEDGYEHNYDMATLAFLYQANKENGSLEEAVHHMLNVPEAPFAKEVRKELEKYDDMRNAQMDLFERLLEKPGFRESYDDISDEKFDEMKNFLKTYNAVLPALFDKHDRFYAEINDELTDELSQKLDNPELVKKAIESSEAFLKTNEDPFFKVAIVQPYTELLALKKDKILTSLYEHATTENHKQAYDISKKIIEINKDYPCEYDFKTCPRSVSEVRARHVQAYYHLLNYTFWLHDAGVIDIDDSIAAGEEFVDKFYTDGNFGFFEQTDRDGFLTPVATYGPLVTWSTAFAYLRKMTASEDYPEYLKNCRKAKEFFEYSKLGSCGIIEDEAKREKCREDLNAHLYEGAKDQIENLSHCR